MDNNVYKTVGKRYIPIGSTMCDEWLTDGFWYVRHGNGCKSVTNMDYMAQLYHFPREKHIVEFDDLNKLADIHDFAEELTQSKEWMEMTSKPHSLLQVVGFVINKCYEQGKAKNGK